MPFISEYNYHRLNGSSLEDSESISIMSYPELTTQDEKIETTFSKVIDSIKSIRRLKILANMESQNIDKVILKFDDKISTDTEKIIKQFVPKMTKVKNIEFSEAKIENSIVDIGNKLSSYLEIKDVDLSPLINKLEKQAEKTNKEIEKISNLLNNENFVKNASNEVVQKNQSLLDDAKKKINNINQQLKEIS